MRTRCKFRVVGVEETEHIITGPKVYSDQEGYAEIQSPEYTEYPPNTDRRLGGQPEPKKYKHMPSDKRAQNVRLAAQYDSSNPEDVSFAEATPSGMLTIYVSNPIVVGSFKPGKNYYLDLTPCD